MPPPVAARLAYVVAREVGGALTARVMPAWVGLLFVVVQFWTVIPWDHVRDTIVGLPPVGSAALGTGLVGAWAIGEGPTLRALLVERPALRPWWRSGLHDAVRTAAIAPILVVSALPWVATAVFWPAPLATAAWRAGAAVLLGTVAMGPARLLRVPAVAALLALAETSIRTLGVEALLPVLAAALVTTAGPLHTRWTRGMPGAALPRAPFIVWRPRSPLGALVWRDVTCLARTAPDVLRGACLVALPVAGLLTALRVRGGLDGAALAVAMGVGACVCAPLGGVALAQVRVGLGAGFHVRRWPASAGMRVASLVLVAAGTFLPTGGALAATSLVSRTTGAGAPWTGLGTATVAVGVCAAGAALVAVWRPGRPFNLGLHLGWVLGALLLVVWDTPASVAVQLAAGASACMLAAWRLARG
ncbi:MAG: hypothetical protein V4850_34745 [Myxococcota bacterium]